MKKYIGKFGQEYATRLQLAAGVFLGLVVVVPSSPGYGGGGGCTSPTLTWSGTPVCNGGPFSGTQAGFSSTLKVCCLSPNTSYSFGEQVTASGSCPGGFSTTANPVPEVTDGSGCFSQGDSNTYPMSYSSCNVNVTQKLTVYDANSSSVITFTDSGAFSYNAAGKMTFTISGDGGTGTMHCPAN